MIHVLPWTPSIEEQNKLSSHTKISLHLLSLNACVYVCVHKCNRVTDRERGKEREFVCGGRDCKGEGKERETERERDREKERVSNGILYMN